MTIVTKRSGLNLEEDADKLERAGMTYYDYNVFCVLCASEFMYIYKKERVWGIYVLFYNVCHQEGAW